MIRLKEVILSNSNELAILVSLRPVSLKVVAFEEISWICRFCKNEVVLEMVRMETICRVTWAHMPTSLHIPFQNKSVFILLALSLESQPSVSSNAFSTTKSFIIKMTLLYVSITVCQYLYLVAHVTHAITALLFYSANIIDAMTSLRNLSIFEFAEGWIFFLFSLIIGLPNGLST